MQAYATPYSALTSSLADFRPQLNYFPPAMSPVVDERPAVDDFAKSMLMLQIQQAQLQQQILALVAQASGTHPSIPGFPMHPLAGGLPPAAHLPPAVHLPRPVTVEAQRPPSPAPSHSSCDSGEVASLVPSSTSSSSPSICSSPAAASPLSSPSSQDPRAGRTHLYKTELCKNFEEKGTCRYGSKCQFAHGLAEIRPLPRHPKYKSSPCIQFFTYGTCAYGTRCRFSHSAVTSAERAKNAPGAVGAAAAAAAQIAARPAIPLDVAAAAAAAAAEAAEAAAAAGAEAAPRLRIFQRLLVGADGCGQLAADVAGLPL